MSRQLPGDWTVRYWKEAGRFYPVANETKQGSHILFDCLQDVATGVVLSFPATVEGQREASAFCGQLRRQGVPEGYSIANGVDLS